jgi:hypothetical protein
VTALVAVLAGAVIGVTLGALGGGGSILTMPVLVYLFGEEPYAATTASLVVVGVTAAAGTLAHHRTGTVRLGPGMVFGVLGIAGSYVGSRAGASVHPQLLLLGFAGLMLAVAVVLLRRPDGDRDEDRGDRTAAATQVPPGDVCRGTRVETPTGAPWTLRIVGAATLVGLLTGFFGVGGGFVVVPALVLVLGFAMPVAVGTSLLVIAVNAASALVVRLPWVELDWAVVAPFTAAAVAGSLAGTRAADRVHPDTLTRAFAVLLALLGFYVAVNSLAALL